MKRAAAQDKNASLIDKKRFADLPPVELQALEAIQSQTLFAKNSKLFSEGQFPIGVFLLYAGKAELYISCGEDKRRICGTCNPGEILGLYAALSGRPYNVTAQTMCPSRVGFIKRDDFIQFMLNHCQFTFRVIQLLSDDVNGSFEQVRSLRQRQRRNQKS